MATLVFTALGTALGGPFGGALGSLVGNQLDRAIGSLSGREGPRLRELSVTTSSYGTTVPRHFGTMRAAGTIIWATDLVESSDTGKGGKGRPAPTTYSYSASFAVALASRPIAKLGRVWADGNLLRGAEGDLKASCALRVYTGHGDQAPDPLIAAEKQGGCPAFRDFAYCVFESLQLADFGNRIPALTFEIIADDGEVTLTNVVKTAGNALDAERPLLGLSGFSNEGGPLSATLATIDQVYPIALDAGGKKLTIRSAEEVPADPPLLPEAAVDLDDEASGTTTGTSRRRKPDLQDTPEGLRYYDVARDYQAGLQRPQGRAPAGQQRIIEFPGALHADAARSLASAAAERANWSRETLSWRTAELDPAIGPGSIVRVPEQVGLWRVEEWEWRERGVELELRRLPRGVHRRIVADPGAALSASDLVATPTALAIFESPPEHVSAGDTRRIYAAASSTSAGWKGAALYLEEAGDLVPLGATGSRRSILGSLVSPLSPSPALILEPLASSVVQLASDDFELSNASFAGLASGANRAMVGSEVFQFGHAERIGPGCWRLSCLLRGRAGTEIAAQCEHNPGTPFVLLDDKLVLLDSSKFSRAAGATIAAIGLGDAVPVVTPLLNEGLSVRPPSPVHPRIARTPNGGLLLHWTRRVQGAWTWDDYLDVPQTGSAEHYVVGVGDSQNPDVRWETDHPQLELGPEQVTSLSVFVGQTIWVQQVGLHGMSYPLHLTTIA